MKTVGHSSNVGPALAPSTDKVSLGSHPSPPHLFGEVFCAKDGYTQSTITHRALSEQDGKRVIAVSGIREMLIRHHASPEMLQRTKQHREAMKRLGFGSKLKLLRLFPTNPVTQKGNLAEIVLAEYIVATTGTKLPVYRLRYNQNIDQSMKGDDVLAFDLDANPVRIIVGEAKFRATSSTTAVREIVDGLVRSYKGEVPASLLFVAEHLFEIGQADFGERVLQCALLFAQGNLKLDYVGLLLSDTMSAMRVDSATSNSLRRLAMISLGVENPDSLVGDCYRNLE